MSLGFILVLLWIRRRFGVAPRRSKRIRSIELVDRLPLTPNHSLHVIRFQDNEWMLVVFPGGCQIFNPHQAELISTSKELANEIKALRVAPAAESRLRGVT